MVTKDVIKALETLVRTYNIEAVQKIAEIQKKSAVELMTGLCALLYSKKVAPNEEEITRFLKAAVKELSLDLSNEKNLMLLAAATSFLFYREYRDIVVGAYGKICEKLARAKYS